MKKKVIISLIIIVLIFMACVAVWFFFYQTPDLKKYEYLKNPTIVELPSQNMMVVVASGDPNFSAGRAFKLLYRTYYSLKGFDRSSKMVAPRARWMTSFTAPKDQWMGQFALPVADTVTTLPYVPNPQDLKLYVTRWDYGTCAEILHIGSYDTENATIKRLNDYIASQGYQIAGAHEEEYLKGPGMFGSGNPKKYATIIRYPIQKVSKN